MKFKSIAIGLLATVIFIGPASANTSFVGYKVGHLSDEVAAEELRCLALNLYYEARSENVAGIFAVADVTLNRVEDSRFPDNICGVVKQGSFTTGKIYKYVKRSDGTFYTVPSCQFSWYCDGKPDDPRNKEIYNLMLDYAFKALYYRRYRGITERATHYHAPSVNPVWSRELMPVGNIGTHMFYRWDPVR